MTVPTRKALMIGLLAVAFCASALMLLIPLSPDGRYYNRAIGSGGEAFFEFRGGDAYLMVPLSIQAEDGFETNFVGKYERKDGEWVLSTITGAHIRLEASLLSIKWIGPADNQIEKYSRMFRTPK